ncbi:hypothetical protein Q5Y75_15665 [Ruegeria sp. 2205SS24-7]|uniref:hypothetical protein n=1 Tax=Ruegeria discodermiae TaxID=3064389 RepID=UPI0027409C83|nr:hypothetical protein [Ruegeria sp. 2205SS24-7]MDP5218666.1 hypothetical protein [Ruegeria sp. 2205SS24-7]
MKIRAALLVTPILLGLGACSDPFALSGGPNAYPSKNVSVMSRTWAVRQVSDNPVVYRATRDMNNLNPFGQPARPRPVQASAAIRQATGCRVLGNTMYENISGQFFAQVQCPAAPAS